MTKIFWTGPTGYIGGDALFLIAKTHPDWEITCLVRNSDKGAKVASQYTRVRLVYGDLDSVELIEEEAKNADIIYHFADCDHEASASAIAKGLSAHTIERPGFWIHTSGTGILTYPDFHNNTFGQESKEYFDDWDDIQKVLSVPDDARHRLVDKIVLKAGTEYSDRGKTAIVCPPTIYGPGRGPDKTRSAQAYNLAQEILARKQGLLVGQGRNVWTQVHIWDPSQLFLLLGEEAAQGGGRATWGGEGYYFAENGEFSWGSIANAVTQDAYKKGLIHSPNLKSLTITLDADKKELISSPDLEPVSEEEAKQIRPFFHYIVGSNARCKAIRARKLLGWSPKERLLIDEVPDIVDSEVKALGLVQATLPTRALEV